MNLSRLHKLLAPRIASRPATEPDDGAAAPIDDEPAPCGWFDSSHDLKHGLDVVEMAWPDTLPIAWPLAAVASSLQPA